MSSDEKSSSGSVPSTVMASSTANCPAMSSSKGWCMLASSKGDKSSKGDRSGVEGAARSLSGCGGAAGESALGSCKHDDDGDDERPSLGPASVPLEGDPWRSITDILHTTR